MDEDKGAMNRLPRCTCVRISANLNQKWHDLLASLNSTDESICRMTERLRKIFRNIPPFGTKGQTIITIQGKSKMLQNEYETVYDIGLGQLTDEEGDIVDSIDLSAGKTEKRLKRTTPGEIQSGRHPKLTPQKHFKKPCSTVILHY